jgi:hypothetical protein
MRKRELVRGLRINSGATVFREKRLTLKFA